MKETINGHLIAIDVEGNGDPVVMVHGLGGTTSVWEPQVQALKDRFTTYRFDLPGSGRSPRLAALSIEGWVEDLKALMDHYKIEAAHLLGHSMGTVIVQHFAVRYPAKVRKLGLMGPVRAPAEAGRKGLRDRAAAVRAGGMEAVAGAIMSGATSPVVRAERPEVGALVRELLLRQDPEGYALSCEALAAASEVNAREIRSRTLLMTGDEDAVAPPAVTKAMGQELPSAEVVIIKACGHWTTIERAKEVNEALRVFF